MTPLLALLLSLAAGLATAVGGLVSVLGGGTSRRFLAGALGFSAGVMLCVSAVELVPQAVVDLGRTGHSPAWAAFALVLGAATVLLVGQVSRLRRRSGRGAAAASATSASPASATADQEQRALLLRTGVLTAVAITVHNFPEGFATFLAALGDPRAALPVVAAIALHNIPEGIAVAVPIHHATGSRARAFLLSAASGMAEPAGALIGWLLLAPLLTPAVMSGVLAGVAGVMIMICAKELIPAAFAQGHRRVAVVGMLAGAAVMQISLMLLN